MQNDTPKNWYSRGYLFHFEEGQIIQFLTYRLADSMPQNILENWRKELETKEITDADFRRRIEIYLDQGYGKCYLKRAEIAEIVEQNLIHFDGFKYKLYAWVIMPNHIHLLLKPLEGFRLSEIVHSCKSYTANQINKLLNRSGIFWFPEPFDRFIRDQKHFGNTITYIENNPVKAKLCLKKDEWRFSGAFYRKREIEK